jgi:hypothetical protein
MEGSRYLSCMTKLLATGKPHESWRGSVTSREAAARQKAVNFGSDRLFICHWDSRFMLWFAMVKCFFACGCCVRGG